MTLSHDDISSAVVDVYMLKHTDSVAKYNFALSCVLFSGYLIGKHTYIVFFASCGWYISFSIMKEFFDILIENGCFCSSI